MSEETENAASLLAKKEYGRAVQLLRREHEKYPSNPRIRLQYADALLGAGSLADAVEQYDATAKYYEENGLTVQAIAVRKKADKAREQVAPSSPATPPRAGKNEPMFSRPVEFETFLREALGLGRPARGHRTRPGRVPPSE